MTLTLVETPGAADSNTYATLVEADEYFNNRGSAWDGYTDDEKEYRLLHAARVIDRLRFVGQPSDTVTQVMQWPRKGGAVDNYDLWGNFGRLRILGLWVEMDEVPDRIKWAQCEIALDIFTSTGKIGGRENVTPGGAEVESESIGRWSIKYNTGTTINFVSMEALNWLMPYLDDGMELNRE